MIPLTCTACGKNFDVADDVNTRIYCPTCCQLVRVPEAVASPSPLPEGKTGRVPEEASAPSVSPITESATMVQGDVPSPSHPDLDSAHSNTVSDEIPASRAELTDFLAPAQGSNEIGRLGHYRVLKVLGSGGMGVVYKAEDTQLQRFVALKAMLPTLAASGSARQRFLREARAAAALKHDNIVTIHQVGEDRGSPFLAMEFLEGEPLDARLKREPSLSLSEILRIGKEAALGLAAAHARGLIHRDIKPANLWLDSTAGNRVKILDFGLARGGSDEAQLTQQGAIVGTPAYMAPEQAEGGKVDARCDLFSLGCVLYRLTTGELPFKGTDSIATLMAVVGKDPKPPQEIAPATPTSLSDLVMRLLAKKPEERPASAQAVVEALTTIEEERTAVGLVFSQTPTSPVQKHSAKTSRRWPVLAAVGLVLALGVACGIYALTRPNDQGASQFSRVETKPGDGKDKDGTDKLPASHFALEFDGKESYVDIPTLTYSAPEPLTMEAWVIPHRVDGLASVITVSATALNQFSGGWASYWASGNTHVFVRGSKIVPNERVHLAFVWDGKSQQLFVDGKKMGPMEKGASTVSRAEGAMFGAKRGVAVPPPPPDAYFSGRIDGVRISKVARYDKDFTPENCFQNDKDTLALYHFAEGQGNELKDSSGNGHQGKIVGAKWVKADTTAWIDLFNGKDLAGWTTDGGGTGNWKVVEGAITCSGERSYLYTSRDDFADFHLKAEVKINELGNSGVVFRANKTSGIPDGTEVQINIKGDAVQTGGLWFPKVTAPPPPVKPDEWFILEVIAKGNVINTLVDGKPVLVNYVDTDDKRKQGYLALQHGARGTQVYFRKVQIKELGKK